MRLLRRKRRGKPPRTTPWSKEDGTCCTSEHAATCCYDDGYDVAGKGGNIPFEQTDIFRRRQEWLARRTLSEDSHDE